MIRLSTVGFEPALRTVRNAPRQIRFASVQAVNATAVSVQRAVVTRLLPDRFTLRSRGRPWQQPGGPFGFNVRPFARMTQAEPYAVLGSRADWLKLQEEGGVKTTASGKALAIPEPGTARPTPTSVVARRNKPAALLAKRGFFVAQSKKGGRVILQRLGRGKGLRLWYGFERSARIPAILGFGRFAHAEARKHLSAQFRHHLQRSLATAK